MNKISIWAIRISDFILYRRDMPAGAVQEFIRDSSEYTEHEEQSKGNIYFDGSCIYLQEWCEYKVRALRDQFTERDFEGIGTFGSENYGTLLFKNCVGYSQFKGTKFKIESPKITEEAFSRLVETVDSYVVNLSYDYNRNSFASVFRNRKKKSDLQYHVFLMLHHAFSTEDKLTNAFRNFRLIEMNPSRSMQSSVRYEHPSLADDVSPDMIPEILSGSTGLCAYRGTGNRLARKLSNQNGAYIPDAVMCEETVDSYDNAENRFIKFFLSWCIDTLSQFQALFLKEKTFLNYELLAENERHIKQLSVIMRSSFLRHVGALTSIPTNSTVLTRRDGYRQLFHLYLGIKSLPERDTLDLKELIENKSLDVLYENFCYFRICDIAASIYDQSLNKKKFRIQATPYAKLLEKKTNYNYFEFDRTALYPRIRIHYNKNYTKESYSKPYDPDISIEIFNADDELTAIYIFDAKFKIRFREITEDTEDAADARKTFKFDDISKMHTYRDAITRAKGAFILYPGTEEQPKIFLEEGSRDHPELLIGVGAFPFRPDAPGDIEAVKKALTGLLAQYR